MELVAWYAVVRFLILEYAWLDLYFCFHLTTNLFVSHNSVLIFKPFIIFPRNNWPQRLLRDTGIPRLSEDRSRAHA